VAINELAAPEAMVHLTRFDTSHGRFHYPVQLAGNSMLVGRSHLPVRRAGSVALAVAGAGGGRGAGLHRGCSARGPMPSCIWGGAAKVLFSHPAEADVDATIVYGVNHQVLTGREQIVPTPPAPPTAWSPSSKHCIENSR
jgi:D-erythrose 4-phosphate dehydrogenase